MVAGVSRGIEVLRTGALSPVSIASDSTADPVIITTSQGNTILVDYHTTTRNKRRGEVSKTGGRRR